MVPYDHESSKLRGCFDHHAHNGASSGNDARSAESFKSFKAGSRAHRTDSGTWRVRNELRIPSGDAALASTAVQ